MIAKVDNYYSQVVELLLNIKTYKQRLRVIEYKLDNKLYVSANDYSSDRVQNSNISNETLEAALDRLESPLASEYREKFDIVNTVEIALAGLSEVERIIIERKYLTGRKVADVDIWNCSFPFGKNKYYEFKDNAVKKIAQILGCI